MRAENRTLSTIPPRAPRPDVRKIAYKQLRDVLRMDPATGEAFLWKDGQWSRKPISLHDLMIETNKRILLNPAWGV
jgi:hypothetical protein